MNGVAMLALQAIDTALDAVANRRPRLPEVAAHRAATEAMQQWQASRAAVQQRIDDAQAAIDAAETGAHDLTVKRERLEAQLKTVIAPREAEALMNQIATLNAHRSDLDDQELEALEQQAAAEAELAELDGRLASLEATIAQTADELAAATAALDQEGASLTAARVEAVEALTAAELAAYDRSKSHHGGVGVAALDGKRCSGCHLDLSPAELDQVKAVPAGDTAECPQCSRFLVRVP